MSKAIKARWIGNRLKLLGIRLFYKIKNSKGIKQDRQHEVSVMQYYEKSINNVSLRNRIMIGVH